LADDERLLFVSRQICREGFAMRQICTWDRTP
jgi:hypothetical protein